MDAAIAPMIASRSRASTRARRAARILGSRSRIVGALTSPRS